MYRARIAFAAFSAALLTLVPSAAHAGAAAYVNIAHWGGRVVFPDCKSGHVCVQGTTVDGYCQDKIGAMALRLNECRAWIDGLFEKQGPGWNPPCVGVGNATVSFVDSSGQKHTPIPVVLVANGETISYSGRYVDAFGNEAFAVHGVIGEACTSSLVGWYGSLDTYVR